MHLQVFGVIKLRGHLIFPKERYLIMFLCICICICILRICICIYIYLVDMLALYKLAGIGLAPSVAQS